jgi:hypothetical protein
MLKRNRNSDENCSQRYGCETAKAPTDNARFFPQQDIPMDHILERSSTDVNVTHHLETCSARDNIHFVVNGFPQTSTKSSEQSPVFGNPNSFHLNLTETAHQRPIQHFAWFTLPVVVQTESPVWGWTTVDRFPDHIIHVPACESHEFGTQHTHSQMFSSTNNRVHKDELRRDVMYFNEGGERRGSTSCGVNPNSNNDEHATAPFHPAFTPQIDDARFGIQCRFPISPADAEHSSVSARTVRVGESSNTDTFKKNIELQQQIENITRKVNALSRELEFEKTMRLKLEELLAQKTMEGEPHQQHTRPLTPEVELVQPHSALLCSRNSIFVER